MPDCASAIFNRICCAVIGLAILAGSAGLYAVYGPAVVEGVVGQPHAKLAEEKLKGGGSYTEFFKDLAIAATCKQFAEVEFTRLLTEKHGADAIRHDETMKALRELLVQGKEHTADVIHEVHAAANRTQNTTREVGKTTVAAYDSSKNARGPIVFFAMPVLFIGAGGDRATVFAVWTTYFMATHFEWPQFAVLAACLFTLIITRVFWNPIDVAGLLKSEFKLCWAKCKAQLALWWSNCRRRTAPVAVPTTIAAPAQEPAAAVDVTPSATVTTATALPDGDTADEVDLNPAAHPIKPEPVVILDDDSDDDDAGVRYNHAPVSRNRLPALEVPF